MRPQRRSIKCGAVLWNIATAALAAAPAALGATYGPCPKPVFVEIREDPDPIPSVCLFDDTGTAKAALYGPNRFHPSGHVALLRPGGPSTLSDAIDLGPGDLSPGTTPSFERLSPATLERIQTRIDPTATTRIAAATTQEPPTPPNEPRAVINERVLVRYEYDWLGRVRTKIGNEGIRHYIYDGDSNRVLNELNENGLVVASYVWAGEQLVSIERGNQKRYAHTDGLGSVTALTDEQGAVVSSYHLDAWGNFRDPAELNADPNRYAFTGHRWESEIGLYRAGARYFSPNLGRFLTQDSNLGRAEDPFSLHRYFYANDNPTRYIDPDGFAARVVHGEARRTGFTVTPEGRTAALTYETTVTVTDDRPLAYAVPQSVGQQVAPLNKAAETGVRTTGVVLQAAASATLAAVPEPTGLTKAGAVYFGARALDEGQALARELATGTPTASFAQRGVTRLYEAGGDDSQAASFKASLTLAGADFAAGLGAGASAFRASRVPEGTVFESLSQVPSSAQLRVLNSHFTPDATQVLQNITTAQNAELAANPSLAQTVLSRGEYLAGQRSVPVARLQYGNAVERMAAREIAQPGSVHQQLFGSVGGPNNPDFIGRGPAAGQNFDITTPGQVGSHLARTGYGPGLNVVTYQRPPLFRLFP